MSIEKNLPPLFLGKINFLALLKAFEESDIYIHDLIKTTKGDFFLSTASGEALERLGQNHGISKPENSELNDESYRKYIKCMGFMPKQVKYLLQELIELFYGIDSTRIVVKNTKTPPFNLSSDVSLELETELGEEILIIKKEDLSGEVDPLSICLQLNFQSKYVKFEVGTNPIENVKHIKMISKSRGLGSYVKIKGGSLNKVIGLPLTTSFIAEEGSVWSITKNEIYGILTIVSGNIPSYQEIEIGDYITIDGEEISAENKGVFVVTKIDYEIVNTIVIPTIYYENPTAIDETFVYNEDISLFFQKNKKFTLLDNSRRVLIVEIKNNEIKILLPATPKIMNTTLKSSAHLHGLTKNILKVFSNRIELEDTVDIPPKGKFNLFYKTVNVERYNYNILEENGISGINSPINLLGKKYEILGISVSDTFLTLTTTNHGISDGEIIKTVGIQPINGENLNKIYQANVIGPNQIKINLGMSIPSGYITGGHIQTSQGMSLCFCSLPPQNYVGSYLYDIQNGTFEISSNLSRLENDIIAGSFAGKILLTDVSSWKSKGYLILNYGTSIQEGPIKYITKISQKEILLDPSYVFQKNHSTGGYVNFIPSLTQNPINKYGNDYACYISDQSKARELLIKLLKEVTSASVSMSIEIIYPTNIYLKNVF